MVSSQCAQQVVHAEYQVEDTDSAADISIPSRGLIAAQSDEYADKAEELQAFQEKLSEGSLASGL